MNNWKNRLAGPIGVKVELPKRDEKAIQQEYAREAVSVGNMQYQIAILKAQIGESVEKMRALNNEAHELKQKGEENAAPQEN